MIIMNKKPHPKFVVPGYRSKGSKGVPHRWRKQRGTDNKKRIARSGYGATPHIGYKASADMRYKRPDGKLEVLVHNESEMMSLAADPENVVAMIAHDVSVRKRIAMQGIADKYKLKVANRVKK